MNLLEEKQLNEKIKLYKKMIMIAIAFFVAISFVFSLMSFAADPATEGGTGGNTYAQGLEQIKNGPGSGSSKMLEATYSIVCYAQGATLFGNNMLDGVLKINGTEVWAKFSKTYEYFSSVGIGLAVMWVLLSVIENAQAGGLSFEIIIKFALKLMVSVYIIQNGDALLSDLITFGDNVYTTVESSLASGASTGDAVGCLEIAEQISGYGWTKCLGLIVENLIPAIIMFLATILIYVMAYSRLIEIGIRTMFAPIGLADAFTHGTHSAGMRYLKKYLGVCIQGGAMIAIIGVASLIRSGLETDGTMESTLVNSIVAISMLGAMAKSQQIINDIAG